MDNAFTKYNVLQANLRYCVELIKMHGIEIVQKKANKTYSREFKLDCINRVLLSGESSYSVSIEVGLPNMGTLANWLRNYKENGYTIIERNFESEAPNQKWYTDVTEFNLRGEKLYLSPILDGFNSEVISFDISTSPNLKQIKHMLDDAFQK